MSNMLRHALVASILTVLLLSEGTAAAQDKVRIGKSVPNSWAFAATDVGIQTQIFRKEGIELAVSSFRGDAQMQTALASGAVDVSLGSGPGLGFRAKGVPGIGVAAMYGPPRNLAVVVLAKSPIKSVDDLKGKRIGVTTLGSLTDWLSRALARRQGWGSDGVKIVPMGQIQARLAAMERDDLDAMVVEVASGFELEEQKKGRIVLSFGDIAKDFYTHVIFATDNMIERHPDVLRRFLRGWFKTIAFMRANKDATVKITSKAINVRERIISKVYDAQIDGFSRDGAWDAAAIEVIRNSLKDLKILPSLPDAKTIYNDQFVPVKL
jgi:ABC-type nitrate/sulfonate/bicarbonate transport system substrate-binding protein